MLTFSKEICSWIVNEAYPEELQQYPNAYFYAVIGDNGRCEYGRGPDQESAFNECEKWKKENSISGTCQPFAIGKEIVWESGVSVVSNNSGCIEGNCQNGKGTMVTENEIRIKVNGKMVKCMDKEQWFWKMETHMKVSGLMVNKE